jgi:hypothetical protein
MQTMKTMRFQTGTGTLFLIKPEAMDLSTLCPCPEMMWEAESTGDRRIREPSIQAMAWLLLAAFSQVSSENCEQKASGKV